MRIQAGQNCRIVPSKKMKSCSKISLLGCRDLSWSLNVHRRGLRRHTVCADFLCEKNIFCHRKHRAGSETSSVKNSSHEINTRNETLHLGVGMPLRRIQTRIHAIRNLELGTRARILKLLRSPRIDSKEPIPPACVAWRAGTTTLFLLSS
jgi:hypothetical protein